MTTAILFTQDLTCSLPKHEMAQTLLSLLINKII